LNDAIATSTSGPATAISRPELGSLVPGIPSDVTVLHLNEGNFEFTDVEGLIRKGNTRLTVYAKVLVGRWHNP